MRSLRQMTCELASWASENPQTRITRLRLVSRIAGLDTSGSPIPDPHSGERYRYGGADPMPARLGDWIEERTKRIRHPRRAPSEAGTNYLIPVWLLRFRWTKNSPTLDGLRTRIRPGLAARAQVFDPSTSRPIPRQWLHEIILRRQIASASRRDWIREEGAWLMTCLNMALGCAAVRSTWLLRMIEDPAEVERLALHQVWNPFVQEFERPASLLLRRNSPSLRDQLKLEQGRDGGKHRRAFAEQQPWAAMSLLDRPHAGRKLREIDRNPAAGLIAAARQLCCTPGSGACPKSINFARYLARRRHDPSLDRILADQTIRNRRIRSLLMEAHAQDGGELISHIRDGPAVVRRQIACATKVMTNLRDHLYVRTETAYDTAALLVRMMIRDRFVELDSFDPDLVAEALIALAADSLAAHAERRADSLPEGAVPGDPATDRSVDDGIRAIVRYFGSTRKPRLTTRQLIRFSEHCQRTRTYLYRHQGRRVPTNWPIVPQLSETCRKLGSDDEALVPLASVADLNAESRTMENCLADSAIHYQQLVMGRIAIVSVRAAGGDRATLELQPVLAHLKGEAAIENWRAGEFRGPGNAAPSRACQRMTKRLVKRLDSQCPIPIPESERQRLLEVVGLLFPPSREINRDKDIADDVWREFYLRALPRRLSKVTPRELMANYFESLEAKG